MNDACAGGFCGGLPLDCDDGDPCTDDLCVNGRCRHEANTAACDDGEPCTVGDRCQAGLCQGSPLVCDDGDPCTEDGCVGGVCEVIGETEGCCTRDEQCALPFERCDTASLRCQGVHCTPCEVDEDCGAAGNRCQDFPSGAWCLVACTVGTRCPGGSACLELEEGGAWCWPGGDDCHPVEPPEDAGPTDVGAPDAGGEDAAAPDISALDLGGPDLGRPDFAIAELASPETGEPDQGAGAEDFRIHIDAATPGQDGGDEPPVARGGSGGCSQGGGANAGAVGLLLILVLFVAGRRRRERTVLG
jgi:hypothetical protein